MPPSSQAIISAAQAIRPELPRLLSPETAADYDRQIAILLAQIDANQASATHLIHLLRQSDPTREWMQRYLNGENSTEITRSMRLPGCGRPIPYPRFKCPDCDFLWSQIIDTDPVPPCGNDPLHRPLQPYDLAL